MKRIVTFMVCYFVIALSGNVIAKTVTFDFADPKNVNAVSIVVDAALEPNVGFAAPTSGTITYDTDLRKIISGKISIPTSGITMTNSMMTKVLQSDKWLNAEKNPEVVFEYLQTVSMGAATETSSTMVVQGNMTLAGVTKKITAPISITLQPGKLKDRMPGKDGDLMVVRSKLDINRMDFNLNPGTPEYLVGPVISLVINLAGTQKP